MFTKTVNSCQVQGKDFMQTKMLDTKLCCAGIFPSQEQFKIAFIPLVVQQKKYCIHFRFSFSLYLCTSSCWVQQNIEKSMTLKAVFFLNISKQKGFFFFFSSSNLVGLPFQKQTKLVLLWSLISNTDNSNCSTKPSRTKVVYTCAVESICPDVVVSMGLTYALEQILIYQAPRRKQLTENYLQAWLYSSWIHNFACLSLQDEENVRNE